MPCKREDLSLISGPMFKEKMLGMVTDAYSANVEDVGANGSLELVG